MSPAPSSPTPRSRTIELATHERVQAAAASLLFLGLLLLHSLLAPAYRGPDEPQHFDLAREWSLNADYDVLERELSTQIERSLGLVRFGERSQHLEQPEALARADRPRLSQLGPDEDSESYNQISQHGPLYSVVLGTAVAGLDAVEPGPRWAFDRELGLVRLLSILVVVPVPFIIHCTVRMLRGTRTAAFIAALVPSALPQFTHINSLVNNDALVVLFATVAACGVARLLTAGADLTTNLICGLSLGFGLLTKSLIVGPMVTVGAAYALHWARERVSLRAIVRDSVVVVVIAMGAGGWWLVRNLAVYGSPQPAGRPQLPRAPVGFEPDFGLWLSRFAPRMAYGVVGHFGWLDVTVGWRWVQLTLLILGAAALLGIRALNRSEKRRSTAWGFATGLLFASPLLVNLALTMRQTYAGYVETSLFPGMQGRYLFPALPFVAVLVGMGAANRLITEGQEAVGRILSIGAVLAVQWSAATTILDFYWGPPNGSLRDQVAAMLTWSPWPRSVSISFGLIALAGVAMAALTAVLGNGRPLGRPSDSELRAKVIQSGS